MSDHVNLSSAGESVQHLAKHYASVIQLGETLRKLGSLEQVEQELRKRVAEQQAAEQKAIAASAEAQENYEGQLLVIAATIEDAKTSALNIGLKAEAEAEQIVAEAEAKAQAINNEAAAREKAFARDAELQQAVLKKVGAEIIAKYDDLQSLQAAVESLKAKFK